VREVRARRLAVEGGPSLVVLEHVETWAHASRGGRHFVAALSPAAIVVCAPGGAYALDLDGQPADLDELRRDCAELDAAIRDLEQR